MAVTAAVVERTPHRLVYLVTQDGSAGTTLTITNSGAATPDLRTDGLKGTPLGGLIALTGLTQAQARAKFMGDGAPGGVGAGTLFDEPRAHTFIVGRSVAQAWAVDTTVDGSGNGQLAITAGASAATAYLHLVFAHSMDV